MTIHPRADAIDRLTNVDGNLIEVTKYAAADFVGQGTNGPPPKGQVDRHQLLRGDEPRRFTVNERGLKNVFGDMPHDRHAHAIATDMVRVVIALRKPVIVI
jgi:hypothetical protein